MSYSVAITRIPVTAHGVILDGDGTLFGGTDLDGEVTLNVISNGGLRGPRLNSVSLKDRKTGKVKNIKGHRVTGLLTGDTLSRRVFQGLTR